MTTTRPKDLVCPAGYWEGPGCSAKLGLGWVLQQGSDICSVFLPTTAMKKPKDIAQPTGCSAKLMPVSIIHYTVTKT
jgi:hypothetical protein